MMDTEIKNVHIKLEELKKTIDIHSNYFSDTSTIKINTGIQELIDYINKKYDNSNPENKIKNFIKINSDHPDCKCEFVKKYDRELMEISFNKSGVYYYLEYVILKNNKHLSFVKTKEKCIDCPYDDWHATEQNVVLYNITMTLEELVNDLNEY